MNKISVLLLDGHTVQAYSVAQTLKSKKYHVTIFCEKKISYGYASKYPDRKIICPSILKQAENFKEFLFHYLEKNKTDCIIPLFDDSADFLSSISDELKPLNITIALPNTELYNLARNKSRLLNFCQSYNIPHPTTLPISEENYKTVVCKVGYPCLIKPDSSSGAVGITYIESEEEIKNYFSQPNNLKSNISLQSYVSHNGFYYNSMLHRSKQGDFSKVVIIKIMRYFPVKGGTGSYSEIVEYPEIELLSKKILDKMNWVGFADIDFIVDKNTNEPKLIEINPRIPACIHAAFISGINFPEIIIQDLFSKQIPEYTYITGQKLRYLAMDVLWFIFSKNRFQTKPSWFKFFGKNMHYQDGSIKDPLVMLAGIIMGVSKYLNPSFRKSKLKNT